MQVGGGEVVGQLLLGAGADDDRADGRTAQQPRDCDLGGGHAVRLADFHEHFDRVVESLRVADGRFVPAADLAGALRVLLPSPVFAGEQAAGEWAPDEHAEPLVNCRGHELVLGLTCLQRVVDLLTDKALVAAAGAYPEGLQELPAGVVRAADVADLAGTDEAVERLERFLERGLAIPLVHLIEVDVVGAEPAQARLARLDQMLSRKASIVGALTHRHARLRGDQDAVAATLERFTNDLLRQPERVDIGRIDQVHACVEAPVDQVASTADVDVPDRRERPTAPKRHRP